jgi:hypothetical protein
MNYLEKITELYAFISSDENGEGVIGHSMPINGQMVMMPFVCADKDRVDSLRPIAERMAIDAKQQIRLIRFTSREDLEVLGCTTH